MIELRILGTLQLGASDGRDLEALARRSKRTALLAYLAAAVPSGLHRRDTLLALFWPELDEIHARAALSQALYVLRNALGDQAIVTRGDDEVGLSRDVVWCDVRAFEAALDAGQSAEALPLYRGGLLEGFFVSDAPEFGRWLERERERLRERAAEGAWALAEARAAARDVIQAVRWARWAAALAPADEAVIRRLMTFLRGQGDRAAALRAYEAFTYRLTQEYELEPSAETRTLAEAIRLDAGTSFTEAPIQASPPSSRGAGPERHRPRRSGLIAAITVVLVAGLSYGVVKQRRSAVAPAIRRIAVMPLANVSGDSTQAFFVDGMHQALVAELGKIEAVTVISPTSVLRYRGTEKPVSEIAHELGVDALVEGSVFRAGDSIRVAARLIDGETERQLWTATYERDLRDVLRLYGELATDIAAQIRIAVTPTERGRLASARQVDPHVYLLALKGQYDCQRWTEEGFRQGIRLLRQTIDRDPTYAPAYARIAQCYADVAFFAYQPPTESNQRAMAAVRRALELDSTLGEAYATLGWVRFVTDLDFDGPDRDYRRALALSPGNAVIVLSYADYLALAGRFDDAIEQNRRAIELDPLSVTTSLSLGWVLFKARRYDESISQLHRTLELEPAYWAAHMELGWGYLEAGMPDAAAAHCDSAIARAPQADDQVVLGSCGWVYGRAGRKLEAEAMLRRLTTLSHRRWLDPFHVSLVYLGLGDQDRAIEWLRKAARERSQALVFLKVDPFFDPLRSDPRFMALLRELGIES